MVPSCRIEEQRSPEPFGSRDEVCLICTSWICNSLALEGFLLDDIFALSYQLLQQLQPGLPLLGSLLAKQLAGHALQGERPHNLHRNNKTVLPKNVAFFTTKKTNNNLAYNLR